jgi:hypothetical protein
MEIFEPQPVAGLRAAPQGREGGVRHREMLAKGRGSPNYIFEKTDFILLNS